MIKFGKPGWWDYQTNVIEVCEMSSSFRLAWLPVVLTAELNDSPSRAHRGNVLTNFLQQLLDLAGSS